MSLRVFVIGYKNHALRIIRHLAQSNSCDEIVVFHPHKAKLNNIEHLNATVVKTDDLKEAFSCSCIFICSPSNTHVRYLQDLLGLQQATACMPPIYCEKPIATTPDEIKWLEANFSFFSNKLMVGFNLLCSSFVIETKRLIKNKTVGVPISASFHASHGLAGKKNFSLNWRAYDPNPFAQLIGNLAIHYIHASLYLFGPVENFLLLEDNALSVGNPDTLSLMMRHKSGVHSHIFCSYATVFLKRFSTHFTDGLLEHSHAGLALSTPRDTYNSDGEFIAPPRTIFNEQGIERDNSLARSVTNFLEEVGLGNEMCPHSLSSAINASKIVLDMTTASVHPSRSFDPRDLA